jgi:hypothetical protein
MDGLPWTSVMAGLLLGVGDVRHRQPAMTTSSNQFAELPAHYPSGA